MRIVCLLLLLVPVLANAEIYRWVDENGVVHYGDRPPAQAERVDLPKLQRMDPVVTETADAEPERTAAPAPQPRVRVEQPRPEQTFRDPRGRVPATVSLSEELPPEQSLVYYLDGRPAAAPTRSPSLLLEDVSRGEHRLSVAIVAGDREIARSEPVTFFMHQPSSLSPTAGPEGGAPTAPASGSSQGAPGAPRPGTNTGSP